MSFLVVANWKANGSRELAESFLDSVSSSISPFGSSFQEKCKVVLCPPFTSMPRKTSDNVLIELGGQDCFHNKKGCTGAISAEMLKSLGCKYVILGHSDRRSLLNEGDFLIKQKALAAIEAGVVPVICVGETLEEREGGRYAEVLKGQCKNCLPEKGDFFVAYEPVWAIGGAVIPDLRIVEESLHVIREHRPELKVMYGGSVNENNICSLITDLKGVAGVLVGGASLSADSFTQMIKNFVRCL
ncbi:triosephosphate isomerase [Anaplasma platys]|nr:triosephosphate isomerase [Anaplasma platys]